jgi:hypothetical protein
MKTAKKILDTGSLITVVVTLVLFVTALFLKGLTHDLLLEAAVFLVSVKLVLMSYKNSITAQATQEQLDQILQAVRRLDSTKGS